MIENLKIKKIAIEEIRRLIDSDNKNINGKKEYKLYIHINKINSHFYIGITKLEPYQRFGKNGAYYKECIYFGNAIQRYGWQNFEHIILVENLTKEQACEYEVELISYMKTKYPNCCYNILIGGELGRKDIEITEEYRDKFRGKNNPSAKSVICVETGRIFDTVVDAAKFYNVDGSNIIRSCRTGIGCGKSDGVRLHWAYYDKSNDTFNRPKIRTRNRKVYCATTGMYFNSMKEAAEFYSVDKDSIWWSCKHNGTTSYGYKWRYADDENNESGKAV